jgi:UDP-N-acetylglucosamine 2-epimerase
MPETKLKVMPIFGTRPEVIKMAPVILELGRHADRIDVCTCAIAQHRDMLDQALDIWQIAPAIDLNTMQDSQTPSQVAARVLTRLEPVLMHEQPDWILVQGDTTTVMAERPEGVDAGVAHVVGTVIPNSVSSVEELLDDPNAHRAMARSANPYGDGHASERIVQALLDPI